MPPVYGVMEIMELPDSMIMMPRPVVVIRLSRVTRPVGTLRALWLKFLDLVVLGRFRNTRIMLVPPVALMVLDLRVGLVGLRLSAKLGVKLVPTLCLVSALRKSATPAGATREELLFRQCGAWVNLLTMVTPWAVVGLVPSGRTVLLPPSRMTDLTVVRRVILLRVLMLKWQLLTSTVVWVPPTRLTTFRVTWLSRVGVTWLLWVVQMTRLLAQSGGTLRPRLVPREVMWLRLVF